MSGTDQVAAYRRDGLLCSIDVLPPKGAQVRGVRIGALPVDTPVALPASAYAPDARAPRAPRAPYSY